MPISLTARLEEDEDFRRRVLKMCQDYVQFARATLDYYTADFDAAHDVIMCYATLRKEDYIKLSKGHPRRFVLPMTATHVHTMTTFLAQALFGDKSPHKVDPGGPEMDAPARVMNELLEWNAEQQTAGMYQLGWLWLENALTYNRGIFYDCYSSIYKSRWTDVQKPVLDEDGNPKTDPITNQPMMETVPEKTKERIGAYNRIEIVSPYDFYVDPLMPLYRFQDGRFAGHRLNKPWTELAARSLLPPDDPMYLSPRAIKELKKKPTKSLAYPTSSTATGPTGLDLISRTAYERGKVATPIDSRADAKDPGVIDFCELWVRLVPKDYEIDDRTDPQIFQVTMGNEREVLSFSEATTEHDMFPYSIGEARPSPFYQFSPSWVMILKNIQDYVDYLKNRHQEAVTRTIGNVFMARGDLIDITDFEDPDKEGKFINILPDAAGMQINEIIRQVPVVDTTAGFPNEMKSFVQFAEATSGANQNLQGQVGSSGTTATEFQGTTQMAAGRLSAIARLLSVQAIVPQTKRFVSNFQQFYDQELVRRIEGETADVAGAFDDTVTITPDAIQGIFDYRAHDGTLPGADTRKVAALSRALEAATQFPGVFAPGPDGIDPRRVLLDLFRLSGMKPEEYRYRPDRLARIQQEQAAAAANQPPPPPPPLKPALGINIKWETLNDLEKAVLMQKIGVAEPVPGQPAPGAPAAGPAAPVPLVASKPGVLVRPGPKPANAALAPHILPPAHAPMVRPQNV